MNMEQKVEIYCRALAFLWGWDWHKDPLQAKRSAIGRLHIAKAMDPDEDEMEHLSEVLGVTSNTIRGYVENFSLQDGNIDLAAQIRKVAEAHLKTLERRNED